MITTKTARMLTRYNAWANRLMFDAVAKLPEGEAVKPRTSLFRNMVHTLNHNYVIDRIWQGHLQAATTATARAIRRIIRRSRSSGACSRTSMPGMWDGATG